jgi:mycothiol synthase
MASSVQPRKPIPPTELQTLSLAWRSLESSDLAEILALAETILKHDGGLPLLVSASRLQQHYLSEDLQTIAAFSQTGQLIAASSLHSKAEQSDLRAMLHPDYRQKGIGRFLMQWALDHATTPLTLHNDALTPRAERLYARFGFQQVFGEDVMRYPLAVAQLPALPSTSYSFEPWSDATKQAFFEVYQASFRERPGFPDPSAEEWIEENEEDGLRREVSLLAKDGDQAVGFLSCADNWIVQVGVLPAWRGRAIAYQLILRALQGLQEAGETEVWLDVNLNNPHAAQLYRRMGFELAGRRARYRQPSES